MQVSNSSLKSSSREPPLVKNKGLYIKIAAFAVGVFLVIGSGVASAVLSQHLGYSSFAIGGAGLLISGVWIACVISRLKKEMPSRINKETTVHETSETRIEPPPEEPSATSSVDPPVENAPTPEPGVKKTEEPLIVKPNITFEQTRRGVILKNQSRETSLCFFSFIDTQEQYKAAKVRAMQLLESPDAIEPLQDRAMGILLGNAAGDAWGVPFEFLPYNKTGYNTPGEKIHMSINGVKGCTQVWNNFKLLNGQWSDDTSMALCLADTLIADGYLDSIQLMWTFIDWCYYGYNTPFTKDPRHSVGLGGNIHLSFEKFTTQFKRDMKGDFATDAGDIYTSGNGSVMRMGPVVVFAKSREEAMKLAWQQSKTTHEGDEAAACCQLMASIMYVALHHTSHDPQEIKKTLLEEIDKFSCSVESVNGLAKSQKKVKNPHPYAYKKGEKLQLASSEENWEWKAETFLINEERMAVNPGYFGSYCMDALALALHCVFTTTSFDDAVEKAIRYGGDADSIGAVAGQIAGSIYGARSISKPLVEAIHAHDRGGEIAARGLLLLERRQSV